MSSNCPRHLPPAVPDDIQQSCVRIKASLRDFIITKNVIEDVHALKARCKDEGPRVWTHALRLMQYPTRFLVEGIASHGTFPPGLDARIGNLLVQWNISRETFNEFFYGADKAGFFQKLTKLSKQHPNWETTSNALLCERDRRIRNGQRGTRTSLWKPRDVELATMRLDGLTEKEIVEKRKADRKNAAARKRPRNRDHEPSALGGDEGPDSPSSSSSPGPVSPDLDLGRRAPTNDGDHGRDDWASPADLDFDHRVPSNNGDYSGGNWASPPPHTPMSRSPPAKRARVSLSQPSADFELCSHNNNYITPDVFFSEPAALFPNNPPSRPPPLLSFPPRPAPPPSGPPRRHLPRHPTAAPPAPHRVRHPAAPPLGSPRSYARPPPPPRDRHPAAPLPSSPRSHGRPLLASLPHPASATSSSLPASWAAGLVEADRQGLVRPVGWLTGSTMDAALDAFASAVTAPRVFPVTCYVLTAVARAQNNRVYTARLHEHELMMLPLHLNGNHWAVAHLDRARRAATVYDSMAVESPGNEIEAEVIVGRFLAEFLGDNAALWHFTFAAGPQQTDRSSCGVFALATALHILTGWAVPIAPYHVQMWRLVLTYLVEPRWTDGRRRIWPYTVADDVAAASAAPPDDVIARQTRMAQGRAGAGEAFDLAAAMQKLGEETLARTRGAMRDRRRLVAELRPIESLVVAAQAASDRRPLARMVVDRLGAHVAQAMRDAGASLAYLGGEVERGEAGWARRTAA
ncbi:hypothetical protein QBC39DRAFT_420042 [Podospora conica]|nr:hypothetical protein QBC39DRAFT_420042 [Schizothecium conicum]